MEKTAATKDISRLVRHLFKECIAVRIRLINRLITNEFDRELEKYGITTSQVAILGYLLSIHGGSPSDICKGLQIEKSTVSRNLARLKEKGWIAAAELRSDRSRKVVVTNEGIQTFERMFPSWEKALNKTKGMLGPSNVKLIHEITKSLGFEC
ncbi:MAG: MarR family winged helix-turn-helix transcriptional regulator [Nitrospiria bacterium]